MELRGKMANVKISYKKFNCLMYQLIYGQGIFLLLFVVVLKLVVIFFFLTMSFVNLSTEG